MAWVLQLGLLSLTAMMSCRRACQTWVVSSGGFSVRQAFENDEVVLNSVTLFGMTLSCPIQCCCTPSPCPPPRLPHTRVRL